MSQHRGEMSDGAVRRALSYTDDGPTYIPAQHDYRMRTELWQATGLLVAFVGAVMTQTGRQELIVGALVAFCAWRACIPLYVEWWQRLVAPITIVAVTISLQLVMGPR